MKKILFMITILFMGITVNASPDISILKDNRGNYTNKEGVIITPEFYNKTKDKIDAYDIENINEDLYDQIMSSEELISLQNIVVETSYIKNNKKIPIIQKVYTLEEYETQKSALSSIATATPVSTTSKYITMSVTKIQGNIYSFYMSNRWKSGHLPEYRSFDIFAMRWETTGKIQILNTKDYSYNGTQAFDNSGKIEEIEYTSNLSNFQTFVNGISLSQNLVDDSTYYYQTINTPVTCTGNVSLFGTYQHARGDVTLYDSKLFTLGPSGMGGVIVFGKQSTANIYDNTKGLSTSFTC